MITVDMNDRWKLERLEQLCIEVADLTKSRGYLGGFDSAAAVRRGTLFLVGKIHTLRTEIENPGGTTL